MQISVQSRNDALRRHGLTCQSLGLRFFLVLGLGMLGMQNFGDSASK